MVKIEFTVFMVKTEFTVFIVKTEFCVPHYSSAIGQKQVPDEVIWGSHPQPIGNG